MNLYFTTWLEYSNKLTPRPHLHHYMNQDVQRKLFGVSNKFLTDLHIKILTCILFALCCTSLSNFIFSRLYSFTSDSK